MKGYERAGGRLPLVRLSGWAGAVDVLLNRKSEGMMILFTSTYNWWEDGGWGRCLKATLQTRAAKNFAGVNGGLSGGFSVRRPGSKDFGKKQNYFPFSF